MIHIDAITAIAALLGAAWIGAVGGLLIAGIGITSRSDGND